MLTIFERIWLCMPSHIQLTFTILGGNLLFETGIKLVLSIVKTMFKEINGLFNVVGGKNIYQSPGLNVD